LAAWKSVITDYDPNLEVPNGPQAVRWHWMWEQVNLDIRAFAIVAGCKQQDAKMLFERLKGLYLIYPNGAVNDYAAKYIQATILSKLGKSKKS
jgi:hypothetical protein